MKSIPVSGLGKVVPPEENHVVIYFLEKGRSSELANEFYRHFAKRKWRNRRQKKLSNWKMAAWEWILKQSNRQA